MDATPVTNTQSRPAGFSLLEVLIMAVILGICALALGQAMMGSMNQTRLANEMRAASFAARAKLEEVLAKLPSAWTDYRPGGSKQEFKVFLSGSETNQVLELSGPNENPAGEVVIIEDENTDIRKIGRDLDGDTFGDGVSMCPWPMDLNSDGVTPSAGTATRALVGVVVRWQSVGGTEQRYELWSVR